jgi:hypothetical protein
MTELLARASELINSIVYRLISMPILIKVLANPERLSTTV